MKRILTLMVVFMMIQTVAFSTELQMVSLTSCSLGGKRYDSMVSLDEIQKSPTWDKTEDFPPLSPRKAILAAMPVAQSIGGGGRLMAVTLQETLPGKWIYIVELVHGQSGITNGPVEITKVAILMNGHAIYPKIFVPTMTQ